MSNAMNFQNCCKMSIMYLNSLHGMRKEQAAPSKINLSILFQ